MERDTPVLSKLFFDLANKFGKIFCKLEVSVKLFQIDSGIFMNEKIPQPDHRNESFAQAVADVTVFSQIFDTVGILFYTPQVETADKMATQIDQNLYRFQKTVA